MIRLISTLVGVAALVPALAALVPALASAQTPAGGDDRARLHFQSGAAYYDAGEYESALREFESAYELSQRPQLFYNMYLCEQAIGNLEAALSHLERYLAEVAEIENRQTLESRLANLRERVAQRAAGRADPGPTEEELAEQRAQEEAARPAPGSQSGSEPAPAPAPERGPNVGAIAGFSVAALGLVGAVIFGPLTIVEDGNVASSPCGVARTCTASDTSTLSTFAVLTDVSLAVALAGAIVGGVFLLIDPGGGETAPRSAGVHVAPLAGPSVAGIAIGGAL